MIETVEFHCFKCLKKDKDTNDLTACDYLSHNEPYLNNGPKLTVKKYSFFGCNYNESVWIAEVNNIFLLAEKGINQIEQAALKTDSSIHVVNYCEIRYQVCELWLAVRNVILNYHNKNEYSTIINNLLFIIKRIVDNMTKIKELPEYVIFNSTKNSDIRFNASYNILHLYLDLKWITLTIYLNCGVQNNIEDDIISLMKDLIFIGIKKFERSSAYLESNSAFLCSCFQEMWLLFQLLIEHNLYSSCLKDFWHYFNQSIKDSANFHVDSSGKEALCCLWILYHIAKIQGYDKKGNFIGKINSRVTSNYLFVEECLKHILQSTCDENLMRSTLQLISFLQVEWWTRDATFDILQMLWEHFYKRIHTSFTLTIDTNVFLTTPYQFNNFVEKTEKILSCDLTSSNSYEIFLYLLSYFLKRNPSFWSKLKGRIYSKLSSSKLATFNDVGLQNLILLLLILSDSVNFTELTEKLLNLLNQLPSNHCEDNAVIWSAHLSLMILYVKHNLSIRNASTSLLNLVEQASANRSRCQLIRLYVDGLNLLEENSNSLQLDQHVLFGKLKFIIYYNLI